VPNYFAQVVGRFYCKNVILTDDELSSYISQTQQTTSRQEAQHRWSTFLFNNELDDYNTEYSQHARTHIYIWWGQIVLLMIGILI
jgi:hypothetical protein